jgi:DNA-binding CsgD family transcriptional regulator
VLPQDLIDIVMSAAGQPAPWRAAMEVTRSASGVAASADQNVRTVLHHAEILHHRLVSLQTHVHCFTSALDHLPLAMVFLTRQSRVVTANAAMSRISAKNDGVLIVDGTLRLARVQDTQHLRESLAVAETSRQRVSVLFGRPSGRMPFLGVVTRLDASTSSEPEGSYYLLGICDPTDDPDVDQQVLRGLYGLTRAESHVASLLLRGRTPEQAADDLCVSIATIRTHIKRLLLKTDTDRQGRLIGALLAGPAHLIS